MRGILYLQKLGKWNVKVVDSLVQDVLKDLYESIYDNKWIDGIGGNRWINLLTDWMCVYALEEYGDTDHCREHDEETDVTLVGPSPSITTCFFALLELLHQLFIECIRDTEAAPKLFAFL